MRQGIDDAPAEPVGAEVKDMAAKRLGCAAQGREEREIAL
jgi:hypothetical protein